MILKLLKQAKRTMTTGEYIILVQRLVSDLSTYRHVPLPYDPYHGCDQHVRVRELR